MSQLQATFFRTETDFFEKITSISGLLKPSQSKDEKKARIKEKLIEYNKEIPECVYLPTNQTYKVVGIVTSSGTPMQSAARVPILVSFEVEDYPGPDNDPILHNQDIISTVLQRTQQRLKQEGGRLDTIMWPHMTKLPLIDIGGAQSPTRKNSHFANLNWSIEKRQKGTASPGARINSQVSEMPNIPNEALITAFRSSYQWAAFTKQTDHDNEAPLIENSAQAKLQEEIQERQHHKQILVRNYFNTNQAKRENEMLSLAIKYVENLQEKPDGPSSALTRKT